MTQEKPDHIEMAQRLNGVFLWVNQNQQIQMIGTGGNPIPHDAFEQIAYNYSVLKSNFESLPLEGIGAVRSAIVEVTESFVSQIRDHMRDERTKNQVLIPFINSVELFTGQKITTPNLESPIEAGIRRLANKIRPFAAEHLGEKGQAAVNTLETQALRLASQMEQGASR